MEGAKFRAQGHNESCISRTTKGFDKVARFLRSQSGSLVRILQEHIRGAEMKNEYDLYSAITFLLVGLGIGSVLAVVFNPKQRVAPGEIDRWRMSGSQSRTEPEKRVA